MFLSIAWRPSYKILGHLLLECLGVCVCVCVKLCFLNWFLVFHTMGDHVHSLNGSFSTEWRHSRSPHFEQIAANIILPIIQRVCADENAFQLFCLTRWKRKTREVAVTKGRPTLAHSHNEHEHYVQMKHTHTHSRTHTHTYPVTLRTSEDNTNAWRNSRLEVTAVALLLKCLICKSVKGQGCAPSLLCWQSGAIIIIPHWAPPSGPQSARQQTHLRSSAIATDGADW